MYLHLHASGLAPFSCNLMCVGGERYAFMPVIMMMDNGSDHEQGNGCRAKDNKAIGFVLKTPPLMVNLTVVPLISIFIS